MDESIFGIAEENIENLYYMGEKALQKWGEKAQLFQVTEELAELIRSVSRLANGREHEVLEEFADVLFMLVQLDILLNRPNFNPPIQEKLKKIGKRLK